MSMAPWTVRIAALAAGAMAVGAASAQAPDPRLADTVLSQILKARGSLLARCRFDILRESPLGDVACQDGTKTAGEAWDEALTEAGLPPAERDGVSERLGIAPAPDDERAGIWRADPQSVARLVAGLRLMAGN